MTGAGLVMLVDHTGGGIDVLFYVPSKASFRADLDELMAVY
jgi:hypothetical protein